MTRFNQSVSPAQKVVNRPDATPNLAGGLSFHVDPEMELYLRACAGLLQDRYYDKASDQLEGVKNLIPQCDPEFVLKLAVYVRNEMLLRSMPVVLLSEVSRHPNLPDGLIRKYVPHIIQRADEPGELLSYWIGMNNGSKSKMSMGLRKGLNDALPKFSEYNLAKYNRDGNVKLRDVLRIAHPKPQDEKMSDLWKRTIADELATPETWEVEISTKGSTAENWNEIAPKMGFMALLRNLRSFQEKGATKAIEIAIAKLTNPEEVKNSKQFPFRFWSAYKALGGQTRSHSSWRLAPMATPKGDRLLDAIITALDLSLDNVESFDGSTAIFVDLSGSMDDPISDKSQVTRREVGSLLGAMARRLSKGETYMGGFGDGFAWVPMSKHDSVMTNMQKIDNTEVGHSTYAYKCVKALIEGKIDVDRVLLFSDMQCYGGNSYGGWNRDEQLAPMWKKYQTSHPKATLYSFDLAGHGEPAFPQDDSRVFQVSGFSEKILDFIGSTEDPRAILDKIRGICV